MKKHWKGFIAGFFVAVLILGIGAPTMAATTAEQLTAHFRGIKILLNGEEVIPKDATGAVVEPFIVDGTTYLPLRAVASALGLDVSWDGETSPVILNSFEKNPTSTESPDADEETERVEAAKEVVKKYLKDNEIGWNRYMMRTILTRDYYYTVDEANQAIESFDWKHMALRNANEAITYAQSNTHFLSPKDLKDSLISSEFTEAETAFALANCNADWEHLAAISIEYLYFASLYWHENGGFPLITMEEVVAELKAGLFTDEQIEYGLDHCGIPSYAFG